MMLSTVVICTILYKFSTDAFCYSLIHTLQIPPCILPAIYGIYLYHFLEKHKLHCTLHFYVCPFVKCFLVSSFRFSNTFILHSPLFSFIISLAVPRYQFQSLCMQVNQLPTISCHISYVRWSIFQVFDKFIPRLTDSNSKVCISNFLSIFPFCD